MEKQYKQNRCIEPVQWILSEPDGLNLRDAEQHEKQYHRDQPVDQNYDSVVCSQRVAEYEADQEGDRRCL